MLSALARSVGPYFGTGIKAQKPGLDLGSRCPGPYCGDPGIGDRFVTRKLGLDSGPRVAAHKSGSHTIYATGPRNHLQHKQPQTRQPCQVVSPQHGGI